MSEEFGSFSILHSCLLTPTSYLLQSFAASTATPTALSPESVGSAKETSPPNRLFMRARMIWLAMTPPAHKIGQ